HILVVEEDGYVVGSKNDKVKKEKHKKKVKVKSSKDSEYEWNIQAVQADGVSETSTQKVKVAILDSGIDYTGDIDVKMRKNFIPGQDTVYAIYEDSVGHGTNVAGIIAAKDNDIGITGLNPNVELYSARILDDNLQAPISRVVDAIYWAIDNKVNIINISFGTMTDSEALHQAIKDAYDQGILIIAAAGNHGEVEYPAAYEEVIAVGSVDTNGDRSDGSAIGEELELVAPGEQILSTGSFGGVSVGDGTSLAAPHVTGIASILWQKDLSCSSDFIRTLLATSANQYGEREEYGYGLVDLKYALKQYKKLKKIYDKNQPIVLKEEETEETMLANESEIVVFQDVDYVKGSWKKEKHEEVVGSESAESGKPMSEEAIRIVKKGAVANDRYLTPWTSLPQWHGFTSKKIDGVRHYLNNYIESYLYITEAATGFNYNNQTSATDEYTPPTKSYYYSTIASPEEYNDISSIIQSDGIKNPYTEKKYSWSQLLGEEVTDRKKSLFVYGLALHTVTDMFAHSAVELNGDYIPHKDEKGADDTTYRENRWQCAQSMAQILISHIKRFRPAELEDFAAIVSGKKNNETLNLEHLYDRSGGENAFKIKAYSVKAYQSDPQIYSDYKADFDAVTIDIPKDGSDEE
ncbi:MAG TPA: S8 family peptidase, partial [Candidatus Scybalomonas excrementigallinarum]|nr:S8 family peptidase [Candidatus Scybalomonas excrementigallinarum]